MSKKIKKQARKSSLSAAQSVQSTSSAANGAAPASTMRMAEKEFNPDYTPVIKDLKRIGSLAGIFIAILVILTFFLR
ncbi:MAG: hypothetical protein GYA34_07435 [Chloroflexi bacterium]|nr:hypothetical protein [Chloroflexota bacterium]